ncbi:polymorphic toxin-type HINT domain-containing protein [Streptomyces sp. XD-27]|uniref:polymorphic toxin-type HINT domain-containing protein n=1 Tax=Streptomyces sp. XD-27 TaxID=3062779 RepID=UPI0026F43368|nr:polymorphic toxin-type HINT domain-containing protein [Streptomyces sp. XD-27]WKX73552.1 polymorphic toxin-type HINT domain-containing protein [Streptomyces sp. XD-27]
MVATLLQAVTAPQSAADSGEGRPDLPVAERPVAGGPAGKAKPRTVEKGPRVPDRAPKAEWARGGSAVVRIPAATAKRGSEPVPAGDLPISLTLSADADADADAEARSAVGSVEARVLDRRSARRAGVDGLLFSLTGTSARGKAAPAASAKAQVRVDYSAFSEAYGGGYASRIRLLELPTCALTTPEKAACRVGKPVAAVNDTEKQTLSADAVSLRSGGATVLAAVSGAQGGKGDYKATSLSPSATWQTNLNTGDFTWSHQMTVPEVPGGLKPNVGLSYSSGGIDGRTGGTNNQSSWVGDGFDVWPGFIERRYKPCSDDGVENSDGNKPGDLCWGYDNAFLSLNGKGGELVPAGDGEWKLKQDDGTRIKRLTGTARGNGDNDNEYWRVTTPDGTRSYFGYHKLNGWASGKETTDSTWTAPVYGDDSGEPCHESTFATSWCQQAWRWNLDYVVDTHGNAIAYYYDKETNSYGRNLKAEDDTPYVRGGSLDRIEYGLNSTDLYANKALAKVTFTNTERCIPVDGVTCAADTIGSKAQYWYDTPWDLNCKAGTTCDQGRLSPTFWTRKRLTGVTTDVLKGDAYAKVDSWKFTHRWGTADVDYQLLLDSIQHTGHAAATPITLPKTTFAYTQLANRLDRTGDGKAPFIKARVSTVADESGGQTDITYSGPACAWDSLPTPQTNTTRCYPQYVGGSSTDDPDREWFNKYVVDSATATDRTGKAPDQVTRYSYLGGAAWHFDDDDGLTKEKSKTWSQWRGYGHVRVQTGGQGADGMRSQEETYFLRGMDGDKKEPSGGTKSVTVALGDDEGDPITDHESAAGFAYKSASYSGPGGKVLSKEINRPWRHQTAKRERSWGTVTANFTGTAYSKAFTSLDDGAGDRWRTTSKATSYDTVAGRPFQVDDFGDTTVASDNQCTRTTYADNTGANLLTLPSRVETVAVACDATPDRTKQVISDVRTAYDGGGYGQEPTKGDATAHATLKAHDWTKATYLESGVTYDAYGRALTSTDLTADVTVSGTGAPVRTARDDGRTTTTAYSPATGYPTKTTVTTPPAKKGDTATAQTTTTELEPLRGRPKAQADTNGKRTEFAYDALGRSTKVWLANRRIDQLPTYEFSYLVEEGKPVAVGTRTLDEQGDGQIESFTLYDGFLRRRQTQAPGPDGGRLLTDTFYDGRGLTAKTFATYYAETKPSRLLFEPENALSVETQSHHAYDGLGRETEAKEIAGNGDGGKVLAVTRTVYGGDRTTVTPPEGGTATTTVTDARGRTTELWQHHTRQAPATHDTTRYEYTPASRLAKVTDPAGNSWAYEYDQLGRQVVARDPDRGRTDSAFDDRGRLTTTTDARKLTLTHLYDDLGRPTELREGSATGVLRATWVYDTISGAKGQLAESTRYVNGAAYTDKITEYDRLYQPTRTAVVIPKEEGALAGTYQATTTYKINGLVSGVSYSAAGALPGGGHSYEYEDRTLRPIRVFGRGMSASTAYSLTGKPRQYELGGAATGDKKTWVTNTYEWGTQRLSTSRVDRQDVAGVDQFATYAYDPAGNVTSVSDTSRSGTDTQCFRYDYLRRLNEAWTQPTKTCADVPASGTIGGPAPYWLSYTYDTVGNRLTETRHDPAGDPAKATERRYSYPPAGGPRPHTLDQVDITGPSGTARESYGYDEVGNTETRTLGGDKQSLVWDAEGHLAKVTQPSGSGADSVTEYVYDADGNRLIGRTPTETTLYLGHTEVVLPKGSTTPKATRYTDLGGGHQAVRTDDDKVSLTLADHHGTGQLAIDGPTFQLNQRRTTPFGGIRGEQPKTWPGTKGFVGGTNDTVTGLTHLGAREYDPATGRFLSVDPIMDLLDPQQMHGYTYADNNPLTYSDPTGLRPDGPAGGAGYNDQYTKHGDINHGSTGSGWYRDDAGGWSYRNETYFPGYTGSKVGGAHSTTITSSWAAQRKGAQKHTSWLRTEEKETPKNFWTQYAAPVLASVVLPDVEGWESCASNFGFTAACGSAATDLPTPAKLLKGLKGADAAKDAGKRRKGSAPSGCKCFLAGTDVLMADGTTKDIEDVELGDKVLATDPETGESGARDVTRLIRTEDDKRFNTLSIATADGIETLTATHEHPFWSPSEDRWVEAGGLRPGMSLRTDDGHTVIVTANKPFTRHARTYNLTVGGLHTYYVLAGETPVLVHNSNGKGCGPSGSGISARHENAGDLGQYTDGQSTRDPASQWYHEELSNDELLDGINNADEGDGILVSRDGTILGGHHRKDEILRRIKDGRIDPDTQIRIDVYDGD